MYKEKGGLKNQFTKVTHKAKYYVNTSYMLSYMLLGIKVSSTKVTNEQKSYI